MPIKYSPDQERLSKLVRETKRYSICEREPGQFGLYDDRYLLDRLPRVSELRPVTGDWIQNEFEEGLGSLRPGPALTVHDVGMLCWHTTNVEILDPESSNGALDAIKAIYEGAVIFQGSLGQVEHFIRTTLDHRAQ